MDLVYIHELRIDTIIGVYEWERRVRQTICLDLEMATESHTAASTDDLQYALDYNKVATRIGEYVEAAECFLVEALAEQIAQLVQEEFGVTWLRLRLSKPGALPNARTVGLQIERGERP